MQVMVENGWEKKFMRRHWGNRLIMSIGEAVLFTIFLGSICFGFRSIGFLFYIGKTRIKEIDKAVLGYEVPPR